jgi:hypothetical protein
MHFKSCVFLAIATFLPLPALAQTWDEIMAAAGPETSRLITCSAVLAVTGGPLAEAGATQETLDARTAGGAALSFGAGLTRSTAFAEELDAALATAEAQSARLTALMIEMFPAGSDMSPITEYIVPCTEEAATMQRVLDDALGGG